MATGRLPDPNTAPVTAKGDLFTYSTTQARLAVGNDGDTLLADSSTSTGLRWQGSFAAGKNKFINGDFAINQRNFVSNSAGGYGFDRWGFVESGATFTYSAQTFTPGTAPVAGYEAANFARIAVTVGNDQARFSQPIEDVRTFAGQTATISFWAKGTNPTTAGNLTVAPYQSFGTGGSPSAAVLGTQQTFVLTANWTRYSLTFNIASIAGKTLGTNPNTSSLSFWIGQGTSTSTDAWTLDIWGLQVEAGSVATAFQTATGTLQGELAACQRYYYRLTGGNTYSQYCSGQASSTTNAYLQMQHPVTMRIAPTSVDYSTLGLSVVGISTAAVTSLALTTDANGNTVTGLSAGVASGLTTTNRYVLTSNNSATAYLGFSAEL